MSDVKFENLKRGDKVLFARVLPPLGYYELPELIIVTKNDEYCTGTEQKTKQTFLFNKKYAETVLFQSRDLGLKYLKEQQEKNKDVKIYKE